MTTRVFSPLARYRAAVAELPATTVAADSADGAIVVVDGAGSWWHEALRAADAGAAGIVVSAPGPAPRSALDRLAGIPIVLERRLFRADVAGDAGDAFAAQVAGPAAVVVECHAPRQALAAALRDALGWARLFARAPLTLHTAEFGGTRGLALLGAGDAASVSLIVGASAGAPPAGRLRVTTLGETRAELEAEEREVRFAVTDASSRRFSPTRFERPERLALRRLVAALDARETPSDLADYARDSALAEAILQAPASPPATAFTS